MTAFTDSLQARLKIISIDSSSDIPVLIVDRDHLLEIFHSLYHDKESPFQFLTDLCGIHYPDTSPPTLGVVYHLHNLTQNIRLRIKSFAPVEAPVFPSLTSLFSSANWMERETYDFFGIQFEGHPDLKRILNMDDMDYFPLRKEYALEDSTRQDKKDAYFGR